MKTLVKSGTVESKFILEVNNYFIYKSVTAYDYKTDLIDFTVSNNNGDEFGRFNTLEEAVEKFNQLLKN